MKTKYYNEVQLPAHYFKSHYELEKAQKVVAIVTMINPVAAGDLAWCSSCVTELILTLENSTNICAATGGVRVSKYSYEDQNFYEVSIDSCVTDNLYEFLLDS
jgi:hypothetical protein